MADFLTHLFLPLTAVYVLRQELIPSPRYLLVGGFGLLPDLDKLLGIPGLLHSLLILSPICVSILAAERWWRKQLNWAPIIVALILSHVLLDFIDGGPVTILYPFIDQGIGLRYPVQVVFGVAPFGIGFEGPFVTVRTDGIRSGFNSYGFITGDGVASLGLFLTIYVGDRILRLSSDS